MKLTEIIATRKAVRALLCSIGRHGYGRVVSVWRDGVLMIGWRCSACGAVKHYEPAGRKSLQSQESGR